MAEVISKKFHLSYCVRNEPKKIVEAGFRQDTLLPQITAM